MRDSSGKKNRSETGQRKRVSSVMRQSPSNHSVPPIPGISDDDGRYEYLFRAMAHGVICQAADGTVIDANPAVEKLLGLSSERMIGGLLADLLSETVHEDGRAVTVDTHPAMIALRTGCEVRDQVVGIRHPHDGTFRWVEMSAFPRFLPDGKTPFQVFTLLEDVTSQKLAAEKRQHTCDGLEAFFKERITQHSADYNTLKAEMPQNERSAEALRDNETLYHFVLETINEGVTLKTPSGEILIWNKAAEDITGVAAKDALGQTSESRDWRALRPDGSNYESQEHPSILSFRTGRPRRNDIMGITRPSGDVRWISVNTNPLIPSGGGSPYGIVISFSDITEMKNTETTLRQNEARLKLALKAAKAGTWEWDLETNENIWSEELFVLFDCDPHATKPSQSLWLQTIHPEDRGRIVETVKAAVAAQGPMTLEWRVNRADGAFSWLMGRGEPEFCCDGRIRKYLGVVIDITERKQMEKELRESETRYRELFNNSSSGIAIFDVIGNGNDFIFKDFNRTAERLDADRKADLIGKSIFEVRPGIERFGLLEVFRRVWTTGQPESHPASLYQDERHKAWYENSVYRLPSGEIVAVFDDVTQFIRAEETLLKNEILLRQVLESTLDAVFAIDHEYRLLINNQKYQQMLSESGCKGFRQGDNVLSPEYPQDILGIWRKAYDRTLLGETLTMETVWPDRLGGTRVSENNFSPLRDVSGSIIGALVVTRDITGRKQAESALAESELKYRYLFETGSDSLFLVDGETQRILDVNSQAVSLYDYSKDELLAMNVMDLTAEPEKSLGAITQKASRVMLWHRKKDGTPFPVEITASHFDLKGKRFRLSAVRDVSEHHKAEEAIREKTEHLTDVNAALRALIRQREEDRTDFEETVVNNIKHLVLPYIESLRKTILTGNQKSWIDALLANLNQVTSGFSKKITLRELNLSNAELRVASLVRDGKSTKEIADILMTSEKTVSSHRDSIRNKLGLRGKKGGLRYLLMNLGQ